MTPSREVLGSGLKNAHKHCVLFRYYTNVAEENDKVTMLVLREMDTHSEEATLLFFVSLLKMGLVEK